MAKFVQAIFRQKLITESLLSLNPFRRLHAMSIQPADIGNSLYIFDHAVEIFSIGNSSLAFWFCMHGHASLAEDLEYRGISKWPILNKRPPGY